MLTALYVYQNRVAERQRAQFAEAVRTRDAAADRAAQIEEKLGQVQRRLSVVDVAEVGRTVRAADPGRLAMAVGVLGGTVAFAVAKVVVSLPPICPIVRGVSPGPLP